MDRKQNPNLKAIKQATERELRRALTMSMRDPEYAITLADLSFELMASLAHAFAFAANGDEGKLSGMLDASANRIAMIATAVALTAKEAEQREARS